MESRTNRSGERQIKVAKVISDKLLQVQRCWAAMIGGYINGLSLPLRKICFGIWCLAAAIPCSLLVFRPFVGKPEPLPVSWIQPQIIPALPELPTPPDVGQQELDAAVLRFNQFRDSLRKEGGADWERFQRMYELKKNDTTKIKLR